MTEKSFDTAIRRGKAIAAAGSLQVIQLHDPHHSADPLVLADMQSVANVLYRELTQLSAMTDGHEPVLRAAAIALATFVVKNYPPELQGAMALQTAQWLADHYNTLIVTGRTE